jgi:hypothetical protein
MERLREAASAWETGRGQGVGLFFVGATVKTRRPGGLDE